MNWKLDKYYSFKEMPLPEKIWVIFLCSLVIGIVVATILLTDFREYNYRAWFGE